MNYNCPACKGNAFFHSRRKRGMRIDNGNKVESVTVYCPTCRRHYVLPNSFGPKACKYGYAAINRILDRREGGETIARIAKALSMPPSSVHDIIRRHERCTKRKRHALTADRS